MFSDLERIGWTFTFQMTRQAEEVNLLPFNISGVTNVQDEIFR
jgi:hypothetical protein